MDLTGPWAFKAQQLWVSWSPPGCRGSFPRTSPVGSARLSSRGAVSGERPVTHKTSNQAQPGSKVLASRRPEALTLPRGGAPVTTRIREGEWSDGEQGDLVSPWSAGCSQECLRIFCLSFLFISEREPWTLSPPMKRKAWLFQELEDPSKFQHCSLSKPCLLCFTDLWMYKLIPGPFYGPGCSKHVTVTYKILVTVSEASVAWGPAYRRGYWGTERTRSLQATEPVSKPGVCIQGLEAESPSGFRVNTGFVHSGPIHSLSKDGIQQLFECFKGSWCSSFRRGKISWYKFLIVSFNF